MRPQAFQAGEVRDEHDNIIRQGAYGKKTPFATADNSGILDYIINNFDVLDKGIKAAGIGSDEDGNPTVSPVVSAAWDAIKLSEANAKKSETNAKASETKAKTSETNAGKSASTATTKASEASVSATNAKASETAAKTSETNAKSSEGKAKTSETNAGASATTATQQATKATTEANRAKTEADRAANSVESLDISNFAKLDAENIFKGQLILQKSVHTEYVSTSTVSKVLTDVVELKSPNNTAISFNPQNVWDVSKVNKVRVCVLLITGAGAPTIEWVNCKLCCEAPAKTANKAAIVTFFITDTAFYLVSAMQEV